MPAHRKTPDDPRTDFTPIIRLSVGSQFLVVNAKSQYKTAHDLVEAAKAKPGQIAHGSSGVEASPDSPAPLLARQAGVKFKHVPYQGGAPAIQAVLADQLDFTVAAPEEIQGQVEFGSSEDRRCRLGGAEPRLSGRPNAPRGRRRSRQNMNCAGAEVPAPPHREVPP